MRVHIKVGGSDFGRFGTFIFAKINNLPPVR